MNSINIAEIKEDSYCTADVYLARKALILPEGTQYTASIHKILTKWGFTTLHTKGVFQYKNPHADSEKKNIQPIEKPADEPIEENKGSNNNIISFYNEFTAYTTEVYKKYKAKQTMNAIAVVEKMKYFCTFIRKNKQQLLILQSMMPYSESNYIVSHAVRSTIFSVIIGIQLDLKQYQLFELATAAMLHEIGLTQLPEDLYMKEGRLSEAEKKSLSVYPLLSFKIAKAAHFPTSICVALLDHHEQKDGSGYPQKLDGDKISLYGRIIAVASSYEASIAPRKYKQQQHPAIALNTIIKTDKDQYDGTVLKALLYALSVYPIGSYVILSDNSVGQVIDVDPKDPRFPIVRAIQKKEDSAEPKLIKTSSKGITVTRPAHKKEVDAAAGTPTNTEK